MAITQVGSATTATGSGSASPSKPTGVVSGDFLVAFVANDSGNIGTPGAPAGWTNQRNDNDGASQGLQQVVWTRMADGSEGASFAFTTSNALDMAVVLTAWRGVDSSTPLDAAANGTVVSGSGGTTINAPSVTTVTDNALVLCGYGIDNSSANVATATVTLPGTLASQATIPTSGTLATKIAVGSMTKTPAGATGTQQATCTSMPIRIGQQVALRPAVATQTAYPASDVSGSWTTDTGATTNLFAAIDETTASSAEYIQGPLSPASPSEQKVRLGPLTDPAVGTGHIVHYQYQKSQTRGDRIDLDIILYRADGTTAVHTESLPDIDTLTTGSFTLTGTEADSIPGADYATGLVLGFKETKV